MLEKIVSLIRNRKLCSKYTTGQEFKVFINWYDTNFNIDFNCSIILIVVTE